MNNDNTRIEFGELRIGNIARQHLIDICETNWASSGPKVKAFEDQWGYLFGYRHNVAVSSGTDACLNACLALYFTGAKPGDEVIVPALSFIATSNAVRAAGFKPVFVDVKKETLNIDESLIADSITEKTCGIVVVHTMGKLCNMKKIIKIANGLPVIEDACEAHGASKNGRLVGHWGDMSCFSFYIAHLVCCGEGGMVSTNRLDLYDVLNSTKCHGRSGLYFDHPRFGLNSKMNDMEASLGLESINSFWSIFDFRRNIVKRIRQELSDFKDIAWFSEEEDDEINCPHGFSVTLKEPDRLNVLTASLDKANIHWKRNFGCIPTQHGAFDYLSYKLGDFPNAEYIGNNGIHVGTHQYLTKDNVSTIISALKIGLRNV